MVCYAHNQRSYLERVVSSFRGAHTNSLFDLRMGSTVRAVPFHAFRILAGQFLPEASGRAGLCPERDLRQANSCQRSFMNDRDYCVCG